VLLQARTCTGAHFTDVTATENMAAIFDAGEQAALRTTGLNMFRGLKLYVLGQVAVAAASLSQIGASVYHGDYTATTFICAALLLVAIAKLVILGNVSLRAAPAVKSAVTRHQANPVGMFSLLTTLIARPAAPPVNLNAHIPILPVHNVVTNPFVPPSAVLNNALQVRSPDVCVCKLRSHLTHLRGTERGALYAHASPFQSVAHRRRQQPRPRTARTFGTFGTSCTNLDVRRGGSNFDTVDL
jgi:hypothetical protein